jgi:hypothetical protein
MTPSEAWKIFQPELQAVTSENWSDDDYAEDPDKCRLAANVEAGNLTPDVLDEINHCTGRDWCTGRVLTAALTVLAAHDRLEAYDENTTYSRRPTTRVILGKRWIV